jgi:ectoine hydroxylase-related dioxygenase (phytanoyl-CoA dioxygenase family)
MPQLTKLPSSATAADVIAVLERDGGCILEGFLSSQALEGLRADLIPLLERQSTGRDSFSGNQTRRLGALFAHTRHLAEAAVHPQFLPVAKHFVAQPVKARLGEDLVEVTKDVRIGVTQGIQIAPGQGAQALHRDDTVFVWRHPDYGCEARVQIMIAVSDFTAENGGTLVVPGSHKWDDYRAPLRSEAVSTEMAAGSALIFLGSCYHAGGQNMTKDELRTGVTMSLDAANLRQEENMYLSIKPEVVKAYPEEIQRLLGWSSGRSGIMGWVEVDGQMVDPNALLNEASGPVMGFGFAR